LNIAYTRYSTDSIKLLKIVLLGNVIYSNMPNKRLTITNMVPIAIESYRIKNMAVINGPKE